MGLNQERVIAPEIRAGYNDSGSTIVKGKIVKLHSAGVPGTIRVGAAATDPLYGVAMADIPNGEYGDVQIGGVAIVLGGGVVAQGAQVTSDADGDGVAAASGNSTIGTALTAGANTEYFEVELTGPGGEAN
jgi:hypothetical protein